MSGNGEKMPPHGLERSNPTIYHLHVFFLMKCFGLRKTNYSIYIIQLVVCSWFILFKFFILNDLKFGVLIFVFVLPNSQSSIDQLVGQFWLWVLVYVKGLLLWWRWNWWTLLLEFSSLNLLLILVIPAVKIVLFAFFGVQIEWAMVWFLLYSFSNSQSKWNSFRLWQTCNLMMS